MIKKIKNKKCLICGTEFTPRSSFNKYCTYDCSYEVQKRAVKSYQKKKPVKVKSLAKIKKTADDLWKSHDKQGSVCAICFKLPEQKVAYTQLHAHHIVGRKNMSLRWDLRNRIWLCPTHHTFGIISAHNSPRWFMEEFFKKIRPSDYKYLKEKEINIVKVTREYVEECIEKIRKTPTN